MITIETEWDIRDQKKKLYLRTEGGRYCLVINDAESKDTWDIIRKFEQEYANYDRRKAGTNTTHFY